MSHLFHPNPNPIANPNPKVMEHAQGAGRGTCLAISCNVETEQPLGRLPAPLKEDCGRSRGG